MKIVLDTNVLVSGLLSSSGPPAWIVEAVLAGNLELVFDSAIRDEYEEVIRRPEFGFQSSTVDAFLAAIDRFVLLAAAAPPCPHPLPDADDEPFAAVAMATGSVLVTGNVKHYPADLLPGLIVQTPRQFIDALRGS